MLKRPSPFKSESWLDLKRANISDLTKLADSGNVKKDATIPPLAAVITYLK